MIYKLQKNIKEENSYTNEMMIEDISKFSKELTLWGSPSVINKWVEFRVNSLNEGSEKNLLLMEEIMNEMRKDLGMKKVKKGNLLSFFINDISTLIKKR